MGRNHDFIAPGIDYFGLIGFASLRKCQCGAKLLTTGNGAFRCDRCGYHDTQNIKKLRGKGLDYPLPPGFRSREFEFVRRDRNG